MIEIIKFDSFNMLVEQVPDGTILSTCLFRCNDNNQWTFFGWYIKSGRLTQCPGWDLRRIIMILK